MSKIIKWIKLVLKILCFPFKWVHNKIVQHHQVINAYATIALVLVSVMLVIVTINSANISKQLGDIETYLAADKAKQEILEQKIIAENLLVETIRNKQEFIIYVDSLEKYKTSTEAKVDYLSTWRIQQVKDKPSFGSLTMRSKLDDYLEAVNLIKSDLEQIQRSAFSNEYKIKSERIDNTIFVSKNLIDGYYRTVKIDELIQDIQDYINNRTVAYDTLNKQMEESLPKLFSDTR